jgi:hypothetical protein
MVAMTKTGLLFFQSRSTFPSVAEPPGKMTKRPFISNAVPSITQTQLEDHHTDDFVFVRWHTRHVLNWLKG